VTGVITFFPQQNAVPAEKVKMAITLEPIGRIGFIFTFFSAEDAQTDGIHSRLIISGDPMINPRRAECR
jgi:hypothetical protein